MDEKTKARIETFLSERERRVFLFDFDGTLVDLVPDPASVVVHASLLKNIARLIEKGRPAFALVTGRSLSTLDSFLKGLQPPTLASHGAECREKANEPPLSLAQPLPALLIERLEAFAKKRGCAFENKRYTLSFHLPVAEAQSDLRPALEEALGTDRKNYLVRKAGRTYEILKEGTTKGEKLKPFLASPTFKGLTPVYIGDDVGLDKSLEQIEESGGDLVSVKTEDPVLGANPNGALTTEEVRTLLAVLAGGTS